MKMAVFEDPALTLHKTESAKSPSGTALDFTRPTGTERDGSETNRSQCKTVLRVLVACEFSGVVRRAFRALGHDAWSCDLLPGDGSVHHMETDVRRILDKHATSIAKGYGPDWHLMIAHPPCTHLSVSGARWFKDKAAEQAEALQFVRDLMSAPIERIAIENPISIISSRIRKPDQIIQPWQFGHGETKATCLWLDGLMPLRPTNIVEGREARVHRMPPGPNRWKERSRTFEGIAAAMAEQWGGAVASPLPPMGTESGGLAALSEKDR